MPATTYIYGLCEPEPFGAIRYVGKTNHPYRRLRQHYRAAPHCYVSSWVKSLRASGKHPELFIIEEVPLDGWQESERFWINYFRYIGANLTNIAAGGKGPGSMVPEIRKKISDARKGIVFTEQHCANISAGKKGSIAHNKGKRFGPLASDIRAKISASLTGKKRKPFSEEHLKNLSIAHRGPSVAGYPMSPEQRKKIGDSVHRAAVIRKEGSI